ncbi:MAG: aminotransferase class V-fold PLP-dependent enzyme [Alphaproteobacteria bacterium]|nr:aminotransferase class V-fold PLP-dependent enzyme [Alphaproteobacteria bacterium]
MTERANDTPGVYLDYQATTPVDPRVLDAMLPWFSERFGNPHSVQHAYGRQAEAAVERAREQIAALLGAEAREIVFTSGATEANNLAVKGTARFYKERGDHIVTLATEHKCVLESCARLEREGFRVTRLPVEADGLVSLSRLEASLDDKTLLVSVMAANNEIGVLQPLAEIGKITRARGIALHTDAAQAVGKISLDVGATNIDLLSISGHKLYAPKGIGVLYVRRRPRARLEPLFDGGAQERGLRSGTVPTPLVVGLGEACAIARAEMAAESVRIKSLRDRLLTRLEVRVPGLRVNGSMTGRLSGNLNLTIPGVAAIALIEATPELAFSTGSACSSAEVEPSYVLRALGLSEADARASFRLCVGRFSTESELDFAAERLASAAERLRASPAAAE